jgi:alkylhydroperoxidase/carboxymuconolactone decarboxylase family protein YurZ
VIFNCRWILAGRAKWVIIPPRVTYQQIGTRRKEDRMPGTKEFAGLFYQEGALDPKTTQLVALAAMAAAGCTS